jgi:hypothetical protein
MNRTDDAYTIVDGKITNPGKFEGEPSYAAYFYNELMDGSYDDSESFDDGGDEVFYFTVTDEEREQYPALAHVVCIALWETETGFVYVSPYVPA